jgi:hypothetical protein
LAVRAASAGATLVLLCGCGGGTSAATMQKDQAFVDAQLIRLGRAACDGFSSGVSYEQLADRLAVSESSASLPSVPAEDLGTVITAAVQIFCPKYEDKVG